MVSAISTETKDAYSGREAAMDLLMVLGTIGFFFVAIAYTIACDKLR